MYKRWLRHACATGVVVTATLVVGATPAVAEPGDGTAFVAVGAISLLGQRTIVGPLALSSTNGPGQAQVASVDVSGVATAGVASSAASRDDETGVVHAEASLADVAVVLSGLGTIGAIKVTCDATQAGVSGTTSLADVALTGVTLPLDPAPNTVVGVPGIATITLNEQIRAADGTLTVGGVHLRLEALGSGGDLVLGGAVCGVAAPPMPMASGSGLWAGIGLLALVALPVGVTAIRRRRVDTA
ncbi:choice-of-anchor P family protein [Actinokineospora cianjurensis]|uniref:LPXTG-motif cell wall-anchored protein n=1 Tax=Actinokineospora cianjurensis TaxID=585224 RepID=A0A421AVH2_9PSEU|nr:choice-of-anchor P family protein [Actinokineospora cianjurensis]RLK54061.1 hypothetical protein CLV68_6063 [Actinokineospora cianjurensis]